MPIPEGENCGNCKFWVDIPGGPQDDGYCQVDNAGRSLTGTGWPKTLKNNWCGRWTSGTVTEVIAEHGLGSIRGTDDGGYSMSGIGSWTEVAPPFVTANNLFNFISPSPGVLQLDYGIGVPGVDQFLNSLICTLSVAAGGNNQEVKVCLGVNGAPVTQTTIRMYARQSDTATPMTFFGTERLFDGTTLSAFIQSSGSATVYDFHMVAEGDGPVSALQDLRS